MFDPIERPNSDGDAVQRAQIIRGEAGHETLMVEDAGAPSFIDLTDDVARSLYRNLGALLSARHQARDKQSRLFEAAASKGYGDHSAAPIRRSADGDRLIDRVR